MLTIVILSIIAILFIINTMVALRRGEKRCGICLSIGSVSYIAGSIGHALRCIARHSSKMLDFPERFRVFGWFTGPDLIMPNETYYLGDILLFVLTVAMLISAFVLALKKERITVVLTAVIFAAYVSLNYTMFYAIWLTIMKLITGIGMVQW